jgi:hypothetical protein
MVYLLTYSRTHIAPLLIFVAFTTSCNHSSPAAPTSNRPKVILQADGYPHLNTGASTPPYEAMNRLHRDRKTFDPAIAYPLKFIQ